MIKQLLTHPLTRGMDIDSLETTAIRRRIIQDKPFLKKLYKDWYISIASTLLSTELEPIL